MKKSEFMLKWTIANGIGMSLGFLAFIQTLMFLAFGFDFGLHWSADAVELLEDAEAERLLRIGLVLGLPLAGTIFTSCQALVLRGKLLQLWTWILAGPLGFAAIILLVWPFTEIWGDIPGPVEPFTIVGGGLILTAVFQWLSLRRQGIAATRWLILWGVGLPLGMVVFMGIYILIDLMISISWAGEVALIGFFVGATAAALSTRALTAAIPIRKSSTYA